MDTDGRSPMTIVRVRLPAPQITETGLGGGSTITDGKLGRCKRNPTSIRDSAGTLCDSCLSVTVSRECL